MKIGNKMYNPMNISQLINILESVKKEYGDLPVWGECDNCTTEDMQVWVVTSATKMDALTIQVSGNELEE